MQVVVLGGYQLEVTFHSFTNRYGLCADEDCRFCCDGACPKICEYFFSLCQRPLGTPISFERNEYQGQCSNILNTGIEISDGGSNFTDLVFGEKNPLLFNGTQWVRYKN